MHQPHQALGAEGVQGGGPLEDPGAMNKGSRRPWLALRVGAGTGESLVTNPLQTRTVLPANLKRKTSCRDKFLPFTD